MNMFLVQSVLKSEDSNEAAAMQVMLFDKHPDGPYMELIEKAFSPGGPVIRHSHYRGKKVYSYISKCQSFICAHSGINVCM